MAQLWVWPRCEYPGCSCKRTWRDEEDAQRAYLTHTSWAQGRAVCYCHGLDEGATFPCDLTQVMTHHA